MVDFHDVRFPTDVSEGSRGGPMFSTTVFSAHKGGETRNVNWQQPLMNFNVAYGIRTDAQMYSVIDFFNAREGTRYGFRYKNWANYTVSNAAIAAHDGVSANLPIFKAYELTGSTVYKRLPKIVRGSVSGVTVDGVAVTEGTDFNIDYDSGEIVFDSADGWGAVVKATLEFDEPVRFNLDDMQIAIDAYNSNTLTSLPLVGVRGTFPTGSVFGPTTNSSASDTYWEGVELLLNLDGVNGATATTDQSASAHVITFGGTAALTTTDFAHGISSLSPGTGYLSAPGTNFALASKPMSIDVFARRPTTGSDKQNIIGIWDNSGGQSWTLRYIRATQALQFVLSTDGADEELVLAYPWATGPDDTFHHIRVDRAPNGWYHLRINGKHVQANRSFTVPFASAAALNIAGLADPAVDEGTFAELIDSVRVTIGYARSTSFTDIDVPTTYPVQA